MQVQLNCGRDIRIDGFQLGYTYGGLLEGIPNKRMNENIFQRTSYPLNWGERKVLKIKPNKDDFNTALKACYYSVWLHSNDPIDTRYHGSELVVIWFDERPNNRTIEEIILSGIKDIDWLNNAEDFEY